MTSPRLEVFKEIWLVDFEFYSQSGDLPNPVCFVASEFRSKRTIRVWMEDLQRCGGPPYSIDKNSLFVAYFASAELSCHLSLGWPIPVNILDLFTEFRCITNGMQLPNGRGLIGALAYFGLDCIDLVEKERMRDLVMTGGPWSDRERVDILDYCYSDVNGLDRLLPVMIPSLDLPRALLRGRYMKAVAKMERNGIPIDSKKHRILLSQWSDIQVDLIQKIDVDYGVYEGRTFKTKSWENFVKSQGIPWPNTPKGTVKLDDATFGEVSKHYPIVVPMKELRRTLSMMKTAGLTVGSDSRNRCLMSPFRSKTGRNQPSTSNFIFGAPSWFRSLIRPEIDKGIAYIDWGQQEFGIAGALSKDELMMAAYESGDPYLSFGKQAGAIPPDATRETYGVERDKFKSCVLAVQYGMGAKSLSRRVGCLEFEARELLKLHRQTYRQFWAWSDRVVDYADIFRRLWTVFGWTIRYPDKINPMSARNFPMQANGAEMLRLACCFATERGIKVCAPIHDAILIEFDLVNEDQDIATTQEAMLKASRIVLNGFELRTDVKIFRHPDRWMDDRGKKMWSTVWEISDGLMKKQKEVEL